MLDFCITRFYWLLALLKSVMPHELGLLSCTRAHIPRIMIDELWKYAAESLKG